MRSSIRGTAAQSTAVKAAFTAPILLTNEAGDRILDQMIVVTPNETDQLPADALVWTAKQPLVITRRTPLAMMKGGVR